ncbi:PREDICTED: testis-expressed sequence 11 protein-like [Acropora digitifera]|uniref:testis-expressed sequence 11 protein-like n=1 Tax=Acropora digitifera TaxID=70779 RepID=UPI00077AC3D3|nr:PREDICTED: testis-expressed sequence 11 protein-like [Acropora digitifera]
MVDHIEDIGNASTLLQTFVKDLRQNQSNQERAVALTGRITSIASKMNQMKFDRTENNAALIQIHSCSVTLWNIAVAMKTGGQTEAVNNAKYGYQNRKSLACDVALQCWDGLQKLWSSRDKELFDSVEHNKQVAESERYIFRVFCYRAEAAFSLNDEEAPQRYARKAKEILSRLPSKESITLAELCYNFGVDTYYREEYEKSIHWLRESYDIRKERDPFGAKKELATTLRLLANAYLDWDTQRNWQMALNATDLANSEYSHPAGLYLKAKLLVMGNGHEMFPSSRLLSAFEEVLQHPDLKIDLGLCAVHLAMEYKRTELAFNCLKILESRFKNSPDLSKIKLEQLDLLLKNKQDIAAKELIETCLVGEIGKSLDSGTLQRFHVLLWEKAAAVYQENQFEEAISWYNYSHSLFMLTDTSDKNIGKLQVAVDAITKMSEVGSKPQSKVTETDAHLLICLAAQLALEQKNDKVAINALEQVIASSNDNQQVLTSLRCLSRLRLTISINSQEKKDVNTFLRYFQIAHDCLVQMQEGGDPNLRPEATWFMKIAWNLALESTENSLEMQKLFLFCCKFSCFCPMDSSNVTRQKNCLVMAAAAAIQAARERSNDQEEKKGLLRQCLEHVEACRALRKRIGGGGAGNQKGKYFHYSINHYPCVRAIEFVAYGFRLKFELSNLSTFPKFFADESVTLLAMYEFEAKAHLGDNNLSECLDMVEAMPHTDPNTFETLAALAVESPVYHRDLSMRSLRIAIKKRLAMDVIDFTKLSKAFHSLVDLALNNGSSSDAESKEEALTIYQDICDIIENRAKGCYPELQILWLMTKAWNCGIHLFSSSKQEAGEKWCAVALKLLHHLPTFKCNYQEKMTKVYSDILDLLEKNNLKRQVEE